MSASVRPHGLQSTGLLCPWDLPGKNTGVGCHFLLQGIFPIQGSNLDLSRLLHWQKDSSPLHPWKMQNALRIPRTRLILVGKWLHGPTDPPSLVGRFPLYPRAGFSHKEDSIVSNVSEERQATRHTSEILRLFRHPTRQSET